MKKLNSQEQIFWNEYIGSCSNDPDKFKNVNVEAAPSGNFEITDELIELYLQDKKSAGSSLVEDFESCGDPLPQVGNYWIVLGSDKAPRLILKTVKTETYKFEKVPERIAIAEGEGDLSIEYWKRVHSHLYMPYLKKWGMKKINEATVITEFFEVIHK